MVASMISDLRRKMEGALDILQKEYQGLRTGRVSPALLEPVVVEAYGGTMPLSQTATVSVSDNRMLVVQVWDKELVKSVDRAIRESGLGVNPITEGQSIRVILPELSEERRKELCKVASKYCEQAKISVRNVRRDGMDSLKKMEKDKEISEDENNRYSDQIQKLTDEFVKKIDELSSSKEKEILKV